MERSDFRAGGGVRTALRFGEQKLNLRPVGTDPQAWPTGAHAAAGSDDLCFITKRPVDATIAHLRECGVDVELGPVEKQGALGAMTSVVLPRSGRESDRDQRLPGLAGTSAV